MYNLELGFSTWNVESVSGKWGQISETLKRKCVDICCLQKVRRKGHRIKLIGNGFEFLWSEDCKAENSMGVIITNWSTGEVVGVEV